MTDDTPTTLAGILVYLDPMQPAKEAVERQIREIVRRREKDLQDAAGPDDGPPRRPCLTLLLRGRERDRPRDVKSPAGRHITDGVIQMHNITLFPGDSAIVNGAELTVSRTVTLSSATPIERRPSPGLADLPETALRISTLWPRSGHRVPMTLRHDLRCPCGSAYVRRSATHHSCQHCQRAWDNQTADAQEQR